MPRVPSRGGLRERATRLKPVDEPEEGLERARREMCGGIHSGTGRTRPRARGGVRAKGEATGLVEGRKINSPSIGMSLLFRLSLLFKLPLPLRLAPPTEEMDGAHANAHDDDSGDVDIGDIGMWTAADRENMKKPILVPAKLVAPTQRGFYSRAPKPGKKAEAELQRAKDAFDQYLANAEYARPLVELLRPHILPSYEAVVGDSEGFSLYLSSSPSKNESRNVPEPQRTSHHLICDYDIDRSAFHPLIDFHLTADAGKLFSEYVSMWPGCFALRRDKSATRKLTDAERAARRIPDKVTPTDVVVSQEAYIAYRSGNVDEPTPRQMAFMEKTARKMEESSYALPPAYPYCLHNDEVSTMRIFANAKKRPREEEEAAGDWWSNEEI